MDCPDCGGDAVAFPLAESYRPYLPGEATGAAICATCLGLHPVEDPPESPESFEPMGEGFPANVDAAVPMALLVGLLDSLALYRQEISDLLETVERAGVDPLLVIDRLADDPAVDAAVDLATRRRQLEQLL